MKSKYNIIKKIKNKGYLVFNTLYQNLIFIQKEDFADFQNESKNNKNYKDWIDEGIIINDKNDENLQKLHEKHLKNSKKRQIITLFVTTACNARCSYCFEQGVQTLTINPKDVEKNVTSGHKSH